MMKQLVVCCLLLCFLVSVLAVEEGAPAEWVDDKPPPARSRVVSRDTCPNLCSNNGRCLASGQCACNSGWTGTDCSIADTALTFGQSVVGSVGQYQFHYYHIAVSDTSNPLHWLMNQTGQSGEDCDLYVQYNAYPTRYSYYARDLSTNTQVDLVVNTPQSGTWFAGVYGWTACSYRFMAAQSSPCPNGCSGHGTCQSDSTCSCASGYTSDDCSVPLTTLTLGAVALNGQNVQRYSWNYYQVALATTAFNVLTFHVAQDSAADDCDIYVKKGELPTFYVWDQRNEGIDQAFTVTITNPTLGTYYAGIYGFTQTTYSIFASGTQSCPNQCSGTAHGSCSGSTGCQCSNGYTGDMCEQATFQMQNLAQYQGLVEQGNWNYYSATALTQQNIQLLITTAAGGDCDVYVKRNANPTRMSFDYRDVSLNANVSITIQNPSDAVWKIGIFGFSSCSYTLSGTVSYACPLGCSGHGDCLPSGRCQCAAGWAGNGCNSPIAALATTGVPVYDQIASGYWKFYQITGVQTAVTVHLLELNGASGFVWLLIDASQVPTLVDYDYNSVETNTPNHNIIIGRKLATDPTSYTVGVYGNPLIPTAQNVSFAISAFATPF